MKNKLEEAYEDMLLRLAIAAECKDPGAGGHIRRVSDYATAIASSMGIAPGQIQVIRYASMMHDIGKIGIPDAILDKAASLTAGEYKKMKRHTLIGGRIFGGSNFPLVKASAQIALTHHEKYDGTGYPKGLKGDRIHIYSRIVSVADYFDAFISKRRYKRAHGFDESMREIEAGSGTFFDPRVVTAFLKIRGTIKKILDANAAIEDFTKDAALRSKG